jgi:hypothetical protein
LTALAASVPWTRSAVRGRIGGATASSRLPDMLNVALRLVEFLDSAPLPDCTVHFEAHVVAGWKKREQVDPPPRAGPVPRPPPETITFIEFDDARAVDVTADAVTDAQGRATLSLSLAAAFSEVRALRLDDKPPDVVEAQLAAGVDVHGLGMPARYRFEKIDKPSVDLQFVLVADVARSIVGDTSATHTTLWFQLHAAPAAGDRLVCAIRPAGGAERRIGLRFEADRARTAVTVVSGLAAATVHGYDLRLVKPDGAEYVLTRGRVRTLAADPQRLTMTFASCHLPDQPSSLNRWHALAARDDDDLAFLIGDQIYADGIEKIFAASPWPERYDRRYAQLWNYQPLRDVMRTRPVYMAVDDHEVADDWGVVELDAEREAAGVRAYRVFQHAHNPIGFGATFLDFSFRRGPAAFYVTDSRTARGKDDDFPIMGEAQFQRMRRWARSTEVRDADLVFVVVPVPPAMLPIAELEKLASALAPVAGAAGGGLLGALAGAVIGFLVAGPAGAAAGAEIGAEVGAFVGAVGTAVYYEHLEDTITEPDVRDAWTYDKNLPDLVHLFDLLFDVANDIGPDGRPGPRPKGVFVLSGDYHFAAIHLVRSTRTGSGHDHRNNPALVQVTSSPISKPAIDSGTLLGAASVVSSGGEFKLDDDFYRARFVGHLDQRNFGRIVFEKVGGGRRYRMQIYVEGESDALAELFELDLDARPVQMRNLIGEVLGARGRIVLLRVHDVGTAYGPPVDRIDGEVVIQLDTEPGRAFGFQLRNDANLPVRRRMLGLLRDAFANDRPVAIDYLRTGQHNGTLIRAAELPVPPPPVGGMRPTNLIMGSV